jgi:hypothetical protein
LETSRGGHRREKGVYEAYSDEFLFSMPFDNVLFDRVWKFPRKVAMPKRPMPVEIAEDHPSENLGASGEIHWQPYEHGPEDYVF